MSTQQEINQSNETLRRKIVGKISELNAMLGEVFVTAEGFVWNPTDVNTVSKHSSTLIQMQGDINLILRKRGD